MPRDTTGPGHWRINARTLDHYRTRAVCGRALTEQEINDIMPGSTGPKSPKNPGTPPGPTGPDKNPPMPPNPPTPDA